MSLTYLNVFVTNSKKKVLHIHGLELDFNLYEELLKEDLSLPAGLRSVPKLTVQHIKPNAFQKMNVSLAVQLFSRSTARGLKVYRELGKEIFKNSDDLEKFTAFINCLFDILNSRLPLHGLRKDSDNHKRYFSLIRYNAGCDDHPTPKSFAQLHSLLSAYTPIKNALVSGNCEKEVDATVLEFDKHLKAMSKNSQKQSEQLKQNIQSAIKSKLNVTGTNYKNIDDTATISEDLIVHDLCGWLIKKATNFTDCKNCFKLLI
uniref:Transposable element P transposase-like GTP-binding insertion domain-containing protein n=1 Tax=Strigamia maritima TaxID=126957 RepID=T1IIM3_STRMM